VTVSEIFAAADRVIVAGGPRSGKSGFAVRMSERFGFPLRFGDSLVAAGKDPEQWSRSSATVARWLAEPGPWIVEGVVTPRAIRKWQQAHPGTPPPFTVIWFPKAVQVRSEGQEAMAKGAATVMKDVAPVLLAMGGTIWIAHEVRNEPDEWRSGWKEPVFQRLVGVGTESQAVA
jgi:hypothetical protein